MYIEANLYILARESDLRKR